jgi:DNA-binding CsgD family transcriptional regulator
MRAAKRRWTPSEQRLLDEMLAGGKTAAEIGLILDRRAEAVWARRHRLKLKRELPGPPYVARREEVNVEV